MSPNVEYSGNERFWRACSRRAATYLESRKAKPAAWELAIEAVTEAPWVVGGATGKAAGWFGGPLGVAAEAGVGDRWSSGRCCDCRADVGPSRAGNVVVGAPARSGEDVSGYGEIMDVIEVASFLRVGKNAIYDLVRRGSIPRQRVGRSIRFSRSALLAWLGAPAHAMVEPCSLQAAEE